jgi:hypothetical protein
MGSGFSKVVPAIDLPDQIGEFPSPGHHKQGVLMPEQTYFPAQFLQSISASQAASDFQDSMQGHQDPLSV